MREKERERERERDDRGKGVEAGQGGHRENPTELRRCKP